MTGRRRTTTADETDSEAARLLEAAAAVLNGPVYRTDAQGRRYLLESPGAGLLATWLTAGEYVDLWRLHSQVAARAVAEGDSRVWREATERARSLLERAALLDPAVAPVLQDHHHGTAGEA